MKGVSGFPSVISSFLATQVATGASPSEVITQRGSAPAPATASALRDAIKTESDSDDNSSGGVSQSKTPIKKRKIMSPLGKSDSPKKSPSSTKKVKSGREENGKPPETPPSTPTSKKRKTSASQPSTSGNYEAKIEKDQVENELEAMFAGMEDEKNSPIKQSAPKPQTPMSAPPAPASSASIPKVELSPALLALSKKKGRPTKEEAVRRLEAGILSKRQKSLMRKGESLESILARQPRQANRNHFYLGQLTGLCCLFGPRNF